MGRRALPRSLSELLSRALMIEREAAKGFAELEKAMRDAGLDQLAEEFESIGREESQQFQALAEAAAGHELPEVPEWEFDWHFLDPRGWTPRNAREAIDLALASERRAQNFYADVAESSRDDALSAFAAEMAADETRHIQRLEQLLAREERL